jgi:hypothetical protein
MSLACYVRSEQEPLRHLAILTNVWKFSEYSDMLQVKYGTMQETVKEASFLGNSN